MPAAAAESSASGRGNAVDLTSILDRGQFILHIVPLCAMKSGDVVDAMSELVFVARGRLREVVAIAVTRSSRPELVRYSADEILDTTPSHSPTAAVVSLTHSPRRPAIATI